MKALKNWFSGRGALPLTAYLLALAVWLVLGAVHFGSDAAARAQGRLAEETMAVTDWQMVGLIQSADGTLTTVDGDPQMILEDVGSRVVRTDFSYTAEFDGEAREMCLYYTTKVGEDYSADRRVFPQSLGSGQYVYTLPRTSLAALRLDPCSPGGKQGRDADNERHHAERRRHPARRMAVFLCRRGIRRFVWCSTPRWRPQR